MGSICEIFFSIVKFLVSYLWSIEYWKIRRIWVSGNDLYFAGRKASEDLYIYYIFIFCLTCDFLVTI